MLTTHAVGIDLGTTYSCLAYLNEQGEPVSLPNQEGELTTPSVVMYDHGERIVGTEALRNAIIAPDRVIQNAKRFIGDSRKTWTVEGQTLTPVDVSAAILGKLLRDAEQQIGRIEQAVITVPAQFSDAQRQATVKAGLQAGLKRVEIINEPVAAALCYVLGQEGLWFTELADAQRILVYDLGGGTFDLSLVSYQQNEVRVIASSGDLQLGGIDWTQVLVEAVADQFEREFGVDPRKDPESLQHLSWEAEQCKRSLTVRPKAALICQHAGKRKTYQIEQEQFNRLTANLVKRTEELTQRMLKDNKMGWAHVDVVLSTGGSSRMPMVRDALKKMSGRTLNTTLSPDQSIAHGATYYAGMLLTNNEFAKSILSDEASARLSKVKQQSVTARGLGVLVRDMATNTRVPYYLIQPNTPLPAAATHTFGTVAAHQKRVRLLIVESGARPELPYVELGECSIEGLPPNLPSDSPIEVTISYDASARVHVAARDKASGKQATAEIERLENVITHPHTISRDDEEVVLLPVTDEAEVLLMPVVDEDSRSAQATAASRAPSTAPSTAPPTPSQTPAPAIPAANAPSVAEKAGSKPGSRPAAKAAPPPATTAASAAAANSSSAKPGSQGSSAAASGTPPKIGPRPVPAPPGVKPVPAPPSAAPAKSPATSSTPNPAARKPDSPKVVHPDEAEITELPLGRRAPSPSARPSPPAKRSKDDGEDEFWKLTEQRP